LVAKLRRLCYTGRMKPFTFYLQEQIRLHPSIQPQDIAKLCYQAAHGAEHLLTDLAAAETFFFTEFAATAPRKQPLYEAISEETVRVNLAAWKARGLDAAWLWYLFSHSPVPLTLGEPRLEEYLDAAEKLLDSADFSAFVTAYRQSGMPALHHSAAYREQEQPAYRIVSRSFVLLFPILEKIASVRPRVLAIDGRAAAGKSTAASHLSALLGAPVVQMDDFFLPPSLRTQSRLAEAGGNIHYERFCAEVLPHLASGDAFAYGVFDCGKMELCGSRTVDAADLRIVEGAYSHHPRFGDYADLRVFFDIPQDKQAARILARNGEAMAEIFRTRWIPMEENYHAAFDIAARADLVIDTTKI